MTASSFAPGGEVNMEKPVHSAAAEASTTGKGLEIAGRFCPAEVADPFDTVAWDLRSAVIKDESGQALFEQKDCEIPASWSQLATNVVVSKYFYGENGTPQRERSVKQLIHRVTRTIADWGTADGYFASPEDGERFYRELTWLCLHQYGAFNSPVWFNVGLFHQYGIRGDRCNWCWDKQAGKAVQPQNPYEYPQGSACFIQSVDDNMESIMALATSEAMLFKYGSGTGTDLSGIRSQREKLSGGGRPSGPLSFMRVYDQIAGVVKSGGKTRRAAKMQSIKDWHPDVLEFIEAKAREEKKARILIQNGYEANFNGEAYSTVLFQNANLSVRLSDELMQAALENKEWKTHWVTQPDRLGPQYPARDMLAKIAEGAWFCGDPGVQYDTTINRWHTCPNAGRINASNPCVTGDTLVATREGFRPIRDLVGQTVEIINGQGDAVWVDKIFPTGHKPIFELKTRAGYRLKLTADHRVWTLNRGDVPACELSKDDVLQLEQPGFGSDFLPEATAELVGAALGDGCITHQPEQDMLFISLSANEAAVAERLRARIDEAKRILAAQTPDEMDGRSLRETRVITTATGLRVGTSVNALLAQLQTYAVLDAGSTQKRLTQAAFGLDRPTQAAILRGLFTTDGTVANYGQKSQYVSLDSVSLDLLQQVQLLLLGFGIKAKIYENRRALGQLTAQLPDGRGGVKEYAVQQMHSLRISRAARLVFEREIGFLPESLKAAQLAELNRQVSAYAEPLHDRVESLTLCGEEDVFDLTEPQSHHFVANGLVVHNCSEYMFLDDTACNLSSVNLMKFRREDGSFDIDGFRAVCRIYLIAQEILVDHASYPTARIATNSHLYRPLGLGYANLGTLIMTSGLSYDSPGARGLCGALTALLHGSANLTSIELAEAVGPFAGYADNRQPMLNVMRMHREAAEKIDPACPLELRQAARDVWQQVVLHGEKHGFRNAQVTVLAPTGTISFLMDCDTTGIEPDIALVKYKQLAGGGMLKIVNRSVPMTLRVLGYDPATAEKILAFIDKHDSLEGCPDVKAEHLPVFDCAFPPPGGKRSIAWKAHIGMMAAAQPFLSGAISKTVNMPRETTPGEIAEAYLEGWRLGLKALAVYRDGSKESQPLNTTSETEKNKKAQAALSAPRRERLPDTRNSITHKFSVGSHEGYITVGLYEDGRPGELFITMAKEGSTIGGLMDCFGTAVSMGLQYGVPLEVYVNKFSHSRFEPMGPTANPDIPLAKSIIDYIVRWLGMTFITGYREANSPRAAQERASHEQSDADEEGELAPSKKTVVVAPKEISSKGKPSSVPGVSQGNGTAQTNGNGKGHGNGNGNGQSHSHGNGNGQSHGNGNGNGNGHGHAKSAPSLPLAQRRITQGPNVHTLAKDPGLLGGRNDQFALFQADAPSCDTCGAITVRNGNCYLCHNCGNSLGCS